MSENDNKKSQFTIFWNDKETYEIVFTTTIFADSIKDAAMQAAKMKSEDKTMHDLTWAIDYTKKNEQLTFF